MTTLTSRQAAAILGLSVSKTKQLCRDGELAAAKGRHGIWEIDEAACYALAGKIKPAPRTQPPPIGRGADYRYRAAPKWANVDEQIAATMAGKVKPLYVSALGEPIKRIKKGEVIK